MNRKKQVLSGKLDKKVEDLVLSREEETVTDSQSSLDEEDYDLLGAVIQDIILKKDKKKK